MTTKDLFTHTSCLTDGFGNRMSDRVSQDRVDAGEGIAPRTMIDTLASGRIPRTLARMKTRARFIACFALLPAAIGIAADVPTFLSGEYQVTTSFGDSETLEKTVCLTNYTDWFDSLRDDFRERGCNLVAEGQEGTVDRYRMDCSNGTTGTLAVKKHSDSDFESLAEVELPIAGFSQTISMRDVARRIGECPPE